VGYTVVRRPVRHRADALLSAAGGMVGRAGMMGSGGYQALPNRGPVRCSAVRQGTAHSEAAGDGEALAENNKKMEIADSTLAGNVRHPIGDTRSPGTRHSMAIFGNKACMLPGMTVVCGI